MHRNKETVTGYHCNTTKITRQTVQNYHAKNNNEKSATYFLTKDNQLKTNWSNRLPRLWDTG